MENAQDRNRWRLMSVNARAYLTCLCTEIGGKKKKDVMFYQILEDFALSDQRLIAAPFAFATKYI